jgi:molybdopterin converting factor small subunit
LKIKFYGKLGAQLGEEVEIEPPAGTETISELRGALSDLYPEASPDLRGRSRTCVGDTIVGDDYRLSGADVVEFFPPLSGG